MALTLIQNCAGGCPQTCGAVYDFTEDFEGPGFENSWSTVFGSGIDDTYATSPAPLNGSYSLFLDSSEILTNDPPMQSSGWWFFTKVYAFANMGDTIGVEISIESSISVDRVNAYMSGTNNWRLECYPNTASEDPTTITPATLFYIWINYVHTTGVASLYVSTSSTRPASPLLTNTGDTNQEMDTIRITDNGSVSAYGIFDHIIMSASEIGDNP